MPGRLRECSAGGISEVSPEGAVLERREESVNAGNRSLILRLRPLKSLQTAFEFHLMPHWRNQQGELFVLSFVD